MSASEPMRVCWLLRAGELPGEGIAFDVEQFVEPPDVAFFVRELSRHKRSNQFDSHLVTDDARSQTEDVYVVVLDSLMSRIDVVANPRADARNLVRRHADPHATAAEQNPTFSLPGKDRLTHLPCEVRIIDRTIRVSPAIDDLMPRCLYDRNDPLLERKPTVITSKGDTHENLNGKDQMRVIERGS